MTASENELRQQIIHYARRLTADGLSPGKSGNLSIRFGHGCLITPSATAFRRRFTTLRYTPSGWRGSIACILSPLTPSPSPLGRGE